MKICFESISAEEAVVKIEDNISGRKLGSMVSFDLSGDCLNVTISKLGKSKLVFGIESRESSPTFTLESEKIALSHRALKESVIEKLTSVIKSCGGKVLKEYGA